MVGMYSVHIPFKITISRYVRASYRRHIERDFQTVSKYNEKNKVDVLLEIKQNVWTEPRKKPPNIRRRSTTKKIKRKHPQNSSAANFLQQSPIYHLHQIPTESPQLWRQRPQKSWPNCVLCVIVVWCWAEYKVVLERLHFLIHFLRTMQRYWLQEE